MPESLSPLEQSTIALREAHLRIAELERQLAERAHDPNQDGNIKALLDSILDRIQNAVLSISLPDRKVLYFSTSFEKIYGYPVHKILADPTFYQKMVHPADAQRTIEAMQQCMRDGFVELDHRIVRPDGTVRWIHRQAWVTYDEQGRPIRVDDSARDITPRKQAEEALVRSEALLRSLLDSQTAQVFRVDMTGHITYCNSRYLQLYSWFAPTLVGLPALSTVLEVDHPLARAAVQQCIDHPDQPIQVNLRKLTADGSPCWTIWEFVAIRSADDNISEIQCVGFDITKEKLAEQALRVAHDQLEQRVLERTAELAETKDRIEAIFNHSGDSILLTDRQGRIQQANTTFMHDFDYPEDSYLGLTLTRLVHPDDQTLFTRNIDVVFDLHVTRHLELRARHRDGNYLDVEISIAPIDYHDQDPTNLVCIIRDITARRRAEASLRASEAQNRTLIMTMSEGIFLQRQDGTLESVNPAVGSLLGISLEQFMGSPISTIAETFLRPDGIPFAVDEFPTMVTLKTGKPQTGVILGVPNLSDAEQPIKWISMNTNPLYAEHADSPNTAVPYAVVATLTDVSTRKRYEESLEQSLLQEKELGEMKSRFVSMASHEFRTPLAAILSITETLIGYRSRMNDAQIANRLDKICTQVMYMKDIMEDVLQLSRIQSGHAEFNPTLGDFMALCCTLVDEFSSQEQHQNRINFSCTAEVLLVAFDQRLMRQAVSNLIANALKYSPPEKPVELSVTTTSEAVTLAVVDHGIGIPPEDLKRLFEPFHRASNVGGIAGTGLGLSITKQAIEMHGGTITVASIVDVGTTFKVTLPGHQ